MSTDGMASPSSIGAGGAAVKITGDASGVVTAAKRAEQSLAGLSEKVRGKIGGDIAKALVGAFGVLALDRTFDSLAERLREDGTASFRELGVTFGEAVADGLKSVPIVGGLGEADRRWHRSARTWPRRAASSRRSPLPSSGS
jgi:hypothetical protein